MERFQSFQTGEYWRALVAIPQEGIAQGEVLLIESIKDVDNKAHEVQLRAHPSKYGRSGNVEYVDKDGRTVKKYRSFHHHNFLVKDFLIQFEFASDASEVRARELLAAQNGISTAQQKLLDAQADPTIVEKHVAKVLKEKSQKADPDRSTMPDHSVPALSMADHAPTLGRAIANGIDERAIEKLKEDAQAQKDVAVIKQQFIKSMTEEVAAAVGAITPYYTEQAAAAVASTEDTRRYVDRLMDGIANLDLYVGKDVHVTTVASGKGAKSTEPLTMVQQRLYVDEEAGVFLDIDEWFDFRDEKKFLNLLANNAAFARQVLPTERCIVLMAMRRQGLDYGNPIESHYLNRINKETFLIIKDGENIYKVHSPIASHTNSDQLFPSKNQFGGNFRGIDGCELTLEDLGYAKAVDTQKRFEMHYKRFLILLCGLDHRLGLFGKFYEGDPSFAFVSAKFQEENFRFIHDKDGEGMLPVNKLVPVREWAAKKNNYLRPGSRMIARWQNFMTLETAPGAVKESFNGRSYEAELRYGPNTEINVLIVQEDAKGLFVKVPVSGYAVTADRNRSFECRLSLTWSDLEHHSRSSGITWLCLDMVKPEELETYINHRPSRVNYISYLKLVKTAREYLSKCAQTENVTRQWLENAALTVKLISPSDAPDLVQTTANVWRSHHNGAPLPERTDTSVPSRVWSKLLDLMHMIAKDKAEDIARVEEFAQSHGYVPLRFVVAGNGHLHLYCAPRDQEQDNRFVPHQHVHLIKIRYGKTKVRLISQKWAMLRKYTSTDHILYQWPTATDWEQTDTVFDNPEQKAAVLDRLSYWKDRISALHGARPEEWSSLVADWLTLRERISNDFIERPSCYIPFALVRDGVDKGPVYVVSLHTRAIEQTLYHYAPTSKDREDFLHVFGLPYKKASARRRELEASSADIDWDIVLHPLDGSFKSNKWVNFSSVLQGKNARELRKSSLAPLLNDAWKRWTASLGESALLWSSNESDPDFDALTGTKLPEDYHPCTVFWVRVREDQPNSEDEQIALFFDDQVVLGKVDVGEAYGNKIHHTSSANDYPTHESAIDHLKMRAYTHIGPVNLSDGVIAQKWKKGST
tara:strand:- start:3854 stop:7132 length:3279 start_codon:yes stop_codon:yes gene_type:complete